MIIGIYVKEHTKYANGFKNRPNPMELTNLGAMMLQNFDFEVLGLYSLGFGFDKFEPLSNRLNARIVINAPVLVNSYICFWSFHNLKTGLA